MTDPVHDNDVKTKSTAGRVIGLIVTLIVAGAAVWFLFGHDVADTVPEEDIVSGSEEQAQ